MIFSSRSSGSWLIIGRVPQPCSSWPILARSGLVARWSSRSFRSPGHASMVYGPPCPLGLATVPPVARMRGDTIVAGALLGAQPHDEVAAIPGIEDRRDASVDVALQRAQTVALLLRRHRLRRAPSATATQVDVCVDHARDHELAGAVDDARTGRCLHVGACVLDPRAFDDDGGVRNGRAAGPVNQRDATNGDRRRRLCLRCHPQRRRHQTQHEYRSSTSACDPPRFFSLCCSARSGAS